jgi:hypothetical protein
MPEHPRGVSTALLSEGAIGGFGVRGCECLCSRHRGVLKQPFTQAPGTPGVLLLQPHESASQFLFAGLYRIRFFSTHEGTSMNH